MADEPNGHVLSVRLMPEDLERLDELVRFSGYKSRSAAIRDLLNSVGAPAGLSPTSSVGTFTATKTVTVHAGDTVQWVAPRLTIT